MDQPEVLFWEAGWDGTKNNKHVVLHVHASVLHPVRTSADADVMLWEHVWAAEQFVFIWVKETSVLCVVETQNQIESMDCIILPSMDLVIKKTGNSDTISCELF